MIFIILEKKYYMKNGIPPQTHLDIDVYAMPVPQSADSLLNAKC